MQKHRLRTELPAQDMLQRVGKIRLGETVEGERQDGSTYERPEKRDYFVVKADESTSEESAAAFHAFYGDKPRSLNAMLPGDTVDAVLSGAWRLYGQNKLKRICNRHSDEDAPDHDAECDVRLDTGGWERRPCECLAKGLNGKYACNLSFTFQLFLPDVAAIGVWQIDTTSQISVGNLVRFLNTLHVTRGSLLMAEFVLDLVERKVTPAELKGKTSTIYVLSPRDAVAALGAPRTMRELLQARVPGALAPGRVVGELPAGYVGGQGHGDAWTFAGTTVDVPAEVTTPLADEAPDALLNHERGNEDAPEPPKPTPEQMAVDRERTAGGEPKMKVTEALQAMDDDDRMVLLRAIRERMEPTSRLTPGNLLKIWPDIHRDVPLMVKNLRTDQAAADEQAPAADPPTSSGPPPAGSTSSAGSPEPTTDGDGNPLPWEGADASWPEWAAPYAAELSPDRVSALRAFCDYLEVPFTEEGISAEWPQEAADLASLVARLDEALSDDEEVQAAVARYMGEFGAEEPAQSSLLGESNGSSPLTAEQVSEAIKALGTSDKVRLRKLCVSKGVKPDAASVLAQWGEQAGDLVALLDSAEG